MSSEFFAPDRYWHSPVPSVVLHEGAKTGDILDHLGMCLSRDFDIKHSTFQLETAEHVQWEARAEQAQL